MKNNEIEQVKKKIIKILKKEGAVKAGIFGSFARGEQKKNSDIDILIDIKGSLLDLIGLEMKLEEILGRKVDLLTYKGINHLLKERILNEEIRII